MDNVSDLCFRHIIAHLSTSWEDDGCSSVAKSGIYDPVDRHSCENSTLVNNILNK